MTPVVLRTLKDSPEGVRQQGIIPGLSMNDVDDLVLSLPSTTAKRQEALELCQRMGLRSPESLLGLVSTEEKTEKYSIPKDLAPAVDKLDSDDQETRDEGSRDLAKASLRQLVDIRYRYEAITLEQRKRLNDLIKAKAEEKWKECGGDPRKLGKEFREGKLGQALILHAPDELKHSLDMDERFREFMRNPHTVDEYTKALEKLERIAAFSQMVQSATKDEMQQDMRDLAWSHWGLKFTNEKWTETIKKQMKFVEKFVDIVDRKKLDLRDDATRDHAEKFLDDDKVDDALFARTVGKLADRAIRYAEESDDNLVFSFLLLGRAFGRSKAKEKELDEQFGRVAAALEKRIATIEDPEKLFNQQVWLMSGYCFYKWRGNAIDRGKAVYASALKTVNRLPEDQREAKRKFLEETFGKQLK